MKSVSAAFIYGSVAKGGERPTSDVDLFVLGKPDQTELVTSLREAERRIGREINVVVMDRQEWRRRRRAREAFIEEIMNTEKIFLVGDEASL